MTSPHVEFVATVIKEKEATSKQEKTVIIATQSGLPTPTYHDDVSNLFLKIIIRKVNIKLKFAVAFSAAIFVD